MKTWSSPTGLIIQPDALLVPKRPSFVIKQHEIYGWPMGSHLLVESYMGTDGPLWNLTDRTSWPARPGGGSCETKMQLSPTSCPRWHLTHLSHGELESLLVAIDEQLSVGAGNPCPSWPRRIT